MLSSFFNSILVARGCLASCLLSKSRQTAMLCNLLQYFAMLMVSITLTMTACFKKKKDDKAALPKKAVAPTPTKAPPPASKEEEKKEEKKESDKKMEKDKEKEDDKKSEEKKEEKEEKKEDKKDDGGVEEKGREEEKKSKEEKEGEGKSEKKEAEKNSKKSKSKSKSKKSKSKKSKSKKSKSITSVTACDDAPSKKNVKYKEVKEMTASLKKKRQELLEKNKQEKIKAGLYQERSDQDDTLEKVKSLEEEKTERSMKKSAKK